MTAADAGPQGWEAVAGGAMAQPAGGARVVTVPELQPEMIKAQTSRIATGMMNNLFNCFLLQILILLIRAA